MAMNVAVIKKIWWPWKVPKWPLFLLGVAVKAFKDLETLFPRPKRAIVPATVPTRETVKSA